MTQTKLDIPGPWLTLDPGPWQPIATAPKDGTPVLVNDTTPDTTPWVVAIYLDIPEWQGWIYDDEQLREWNPLGPHPTHWILVPEVPTGG